MVERLDWMEGYYGTIAYQLNTMARYLPRRPNDITPGKLGYLLALPFAALRLQFGWLSVFFHRLEMRHKTTSLGYPKNYRAIATRPRLAAGDI
jgi:hypothetical protein